MDCLSSAVRSRVRQVDCVTVKGSNQPMGMFTYDIALDGVAEGVIQLWCMQGSSCMYGGPKLMLYGCHTHCLEKLMEVRCYSKRSFLENKYEHMVNWISMKSCVQGFIIMSAICYLLTRLCSHRLGTTKWVTNISIHHQFILLGKKDGVQASWSQLQERIGIWYEQKRGRYQNQADLQQHHLYKAP